MVRFKLLKSCVVLLVLSGCGNLPTSGPNQTKVMGLQNQQALVSVPDVSVVDVDERVISTLYAAGKGQSLADV